MKKSKKKKKKKKNEQENQPLTFHYFWKKRAPHTREYNWPRRKRGFTEFPLTIIGYCIPYIVYHNRRINQRAKKVVSDSPGLADFAIGLVNSVLHLPDGQVQCSLRNSPYRRTVKSKILWVVEMTFGLVNVSFSLPEWQALKMTFFAP